ncbi:MAG: trypsin-like peptidase domain-containing protein [Deltaproteobacteria bacterium]|nr:trypsin-like peptidase domain-containing protein [Deltaproteobacteria bacterium]MBI3390750.1 trypsin-like peptidase domain-containing protein [Deltaproteobacteria bacterium]
MASSAVKQEMFEAVKERIRDSVAILASDQGTNQFSGTFVEFSGDLFLATASHCLSDIRDWDTLRLATAQAGPPGIAAKGFHRALVEPRSADEIPREDVAVIRVPGDMAARLRVTPVPWAECSSADLRPGALVAILGFPWRMVSVLSDSPVILKPGPFLYVANVSSRKPHPDRDALKTPVDETVDVFIGYDPKDIASSSDGAPLPEVPPCGLSGAGVFVVPRLEESSLWTLGNMKLGAIQSSFAGGSKLLRAKRIELLGALLRALHRGTGGSSPNNPIETDAKSGRGSSG